MSFLSLPDKCTHLSLNHRQINLFAIRFPSFYYVSHVLREDPASVKELDFVMEKDGKLIGQNMFMKTVIKADNGRDIHVLTMGPIGITPELKRRGYGKNCWIIPR